MSFVSGALAVYVAWVAATWLLEGLPRTLLRPDAAALRLTYALIANLGIGLVLSLWLIRRQLRAGYGAPQDYGFSGPIRRWASVVAAALLGYGLFRLSHAQPVDPAVFAQVFAQVWVVSAAEIVVCWALLAATLRRSLRGWSDAGSLLAGAAAASILFGVYHFAHSPPFNEWHMVLFLMVIGAATSAWWFVSRDILGTTVFHNFFAVTGVLGALEGQAPGIASSSAAAAIFLMAGLAAAALAWPAIRWRAGAR